MGIRVLSPSGYLGRRPGRRDRKRSAEHRENYNLRDGALTISEVPSDRQALINLPAGLIRAALRLATHCA